jgi:hypothetical protein
MRSELPEALSGAWRTSFTIAVGVLVMVTAPVGAGEITGVHQSGSAVTVTTPESGNDDVGFTDLSRNSVDADVPVAPGGQPTDVVFEVTNAGNGAPHVTEYTWLGPVRNNTEIAWHGLRVELGFGTGAQFRRADVAGLDFDDPQPLFLTSLDSIGQKPSRPHRDVLLWQNIVFTSAAPQRIMAFDVPDLPMEQVPDDVELKGGNGYKLTVRHVALPEPSTAALTAGATLSGMLVRPPRQGRLRSAQ